VSLFVRTREALNVSTAKDRPLANYPPPPNNIGKRRLIKTQRGVVRHLVIEDEITQPQTNAPHKLIVFQKMYHEEEDRYEFRLGYYMIGVKGKPKGRWVWGQYCLLIPQADLLSIINRAKRKKWF
jgi:hypothetical protein